MDSIWIILGTVAYLSLVLWVALCRESLTLTRRRRRRRPTDD
jgi:hypothetical protein